MRVIPADRKVEPEEAAKSDDVVTVDLSRLRVVVEPGVEWRQMFDEAGRLMRDHYYRADMNGVDWDAALARYRPLVDRAGSTDDLVDVLWEVQGELGTSHAYVQGATAGEPALTGDARRRPGAGRRWTVAGAANPARRTLRSACPLATDGTRGGDRLR